MRSDVDALQWLEERPASRVVRAGVLTVIWVFVMAPIAAVFVASLGPSPLPKLPPDGITLHWYSVALQQEDAIAALRTSGLVGLASALLALVVGIPVAYAIARYRFRGRQFVETVVALPIILPQIIIGIGLVIFFSRSALLSPTQQLIVAHAIVIVPFAVRIMTSSFIAIPADLEEAAKVFGASAPGAFARIVLPLARVGMLAAAAIAFVVSFTQFTVSLFVFSGDAKPYPIWMYQAVTSDYTPMIPIAVSAMVIIGLVAIVVLVERLSGFAGLLDVDDR